jgi:hypothetical protein
MFNRLKRFCVVAGYLSERVFITYYDVSIDATLTPLDILRAALRRRGEYDGYDNIEVLVSELRKKFKVVLTVFDEAEKWYRERTAPDEEIHTSKQAIGQLYSLGCQPGSTVILCGSSSKLVDLALKRRLTETSKALGNAYYDYVDLNNQKYKPLVLPPVELENVEGYLRVCCAFFN